MNATIFTFDHKEQKIGKALGINESYLEELNDKTKDIIWNLKVDTVNEKILDCQTSKLVEAALNEYSYSQLVILAGFYLRSRIEEMEENAMRKYAELKLGGGTDELLDKIKSMGHNVSTIDGEDLPKEIKDLLDEFIRRRIEEDGDED
jgi:hypothetical protein